MPPRVAVIVPLYRSQVTLRRSLEALRAQSERDFSIHLVDSSPDDECGVIARQFPEADYWRATERMWPQEARNAGAQRSRSELVVFTDPDCYPEPNWIARLLDAHRACGEPVVGAIACHGNRWRDRAIHLTKFSKWLPGRGVEAVDMGPTANLLCPRALYEELGGFSDDPLMGDTSFSWRLVRSGRRLRFAGDAVVAHHHVDRLGTFLRERLRRGRLFGRLRSAWNGGGRLRAAGLCLASVLPLRLASNLVHTLRHAHQAGALAANLSCVPVVVLGHGASLLGEARAYAATAVAGPAVPAARRATPRARNG